MGGSCVFVVSVNLAVVSKGSTGVFLEIQSRGVSPKLVSHSMTSMPSRGATILVWVRIRMIGFLCTNWIFVVATHRKLQLFLDINLTTL